MATVTIICPHCDSQFRYRMPQARKMKSLRIRPNGSGGRFEYTATVDSNILESGQFTRFDDLILFPTGAAVGGIIGLLAGVAVSSALQIGPEPVIYLVGIGCSAGLLLTQWWLCDEAVIQRKAWRWFNGLSARWLMVDEDEYKPVVLEVTHRERDGAGEAGRTIQYFGALPVEPEVFNDYVKSIAAGETLAIAQWTGKGRPFSRQEYEKLLEILRQAGAVINAPGKGHQLTMAGRRAIKNHLRGEAQ